MAKRKSTKVSNTPGAANPSVIPPVTEDETERPEKTDEQVAAAAAVPADADVHWVTIRVPIVRDVKSRHQLDLRIQAELASRRELQLVWRQIHEGFKALSPKATQSFMRRPGHTISDSLRAILRLVEEAMKDGV